MWFDSFEKMNCKVLPEKKYFKDEKSYELAKENFDCKTYKDYHDIYHISDVVLLANIFYVFRKEIFDKFGVDCCYYFGLPSLSGIMSDCKLPYKFVGECAPNSYTIDMIKKMDTNGDKCYFFVVDVKYPEH